VRQFRPLGLNDLAHLVGNSLDPFELKQVLVQPLEIGWHHDLAADDSWNVGAPLRHCVTSIGNAVMKDRAHFSFRVDMWDDDGENIIEHLAGVEDFKVALATYRVACERWPKAAITLRQGTRVIEDSRRRRIASR
jgi:hypothetical protein